MAKRGISPSKAQQKLAQSLGMAEGWRERGTKPRREEYARECRLMSETRQRTGGWIAGVGTKRKKAGKRAAC